MTILKFATRVRVWESLPFPMPNHSLNGSSDSVNGDLQFLWEWPIFTPHKINTPEPIDKQFGTIDYIREGTSYTNFGRNPFTGSFWANGWNITKIIFMYLFIYTFFFFDQPTGQTRGWIFTRDSSKDVKSRLFGVIKLKFDFKPLFILHWWSNEMGLCFSKFWGISRRYGSPHKLA